MLVKEKLLVSISPALLKEYSREVGVQKCSIFCWWHKIVKKDWRIRSSMGKLCIINLLNEWWDGGWPVWPSANVMSVSRECFPMCIVSWICLIWSSVIWQSRGWDDRPIGSVWRPEDKENFGVEVWCDAIHILQFSFSFQDAWLTEFLWFFKYAVLLGDFGRDIVNMFSLLIVHTGGCISMFDIFVFDFLPVVRLLDLLEIYIGEDTKDHIVIPFWDFLLEMFVVGITFDVQLLLCWDSLDPSWNQYQLDWSPYGELWFLGQPALQRMKAFYRFLSQFSLWFFLGMKFVKQRWDSGHVVESTVV